MGYLSGKLNTWTKAHFSCTHNFKKFVDTAKEEP